MKYSHRDNKQFTSYIYKDPRKLHNKLVKKNGFAASTPTEYLQCRKIFFCTCRQRGNKLNVRKKAKHLPSKLFKRSYICLFQTTATVIFATSKTTHVSFIRLFENFVTFEHPLFNGIVNEKDYEDFFLLNSTNSPEHNH